MAPRRTTRIRLLCQTTTQWRALICGAFVLAVLGAKLWIISRFGNPTPLNDEWDAQVASLFIPYFDSTLSLQQLLAPHNEHRVLTTRVVSLLLMAANGLWDPILEMIVNATIHVALGISILIVIGRHLDRYAFAALAAVTAILLAVPNAVENPVWGLETHFYCVLLFGFIAIDLLVRDAESTARRAIGVIVAILSFFSLAAGAFVFLACAAVVIAKRLLGVERGRWEWAFAAALLAGCVLAVMATPILAAHEVYRAHSVGEFFRAFAAVAGWLLRPYLIVATVVVNAPWLALAWRTLRRPPPSNDIAWVLLALGLWLGLQFAALAFARAFGIDATRYLDVCALNLIVNFACAAVMGGGPLRKRLVAGWVAVIAVGWVIQTVRHVPQELQARHLLSLRQEENVKAFLTTGRYLPGASNADLSIPYPLPNRLDGLLSDPRVRRFLPSAFQDAMAKQLPAGEASTKRDRLAGIRDALLRAGPYMASIGLLLFLLALGMLFASRGDAAPRPTRANAE
jgi:hypothetical protein